MKTFVVGSDMHVPYHDPKLMDLWVDFIHLTQPDGIHILGDFQNCGAISLKFTDAAKDWRDHRLAFELELGATLLQRLREEFPDTDIHFHEGNHEWRLDRYIRTHAKPLQGLKYMSMRDQLELDSLHITHHEYGSLIPIGKLHLTHGDLIRTGSGATARAMLQKYGKSVLFGHTHRLGAVFRTDGRDTCGAWENGCMCQLSQPYTMGPTDWQQGWSIIHTDMRSRYQVTQVAVVGHKYIYGGELHEHRGRPKFTAGLTTARS